MANSLIDVLSLPDVLRHRIFCRVEPGNSNNNDDDDNSNSSFMTTTSTKKSFVLYLPTVVLRKRHNPAFSLACRLANHHKVPVIVLCTVLDDQHLSRKPLSPIVMTARRLAFTLEALQGCAKEWEDHGAGVAIRLHGPGARTPHHLTLIHKAIAVVGDEPFVEPFRTYIRKVTTSCQAAKVPCFTVDGSTTVPPKYKLKLATNQPDNGEFYFQGVPGKAWIWERQTNPYRKSHVYGAVRDRHLDAPDLDVKLPANFFLNEKLKNSTHHESVASVTNIWGQSSLSCPGQRPWTVGELLEIQDVKDWIMQKSWPGADISVPPCKQTCGSSSAAQARWQQFRDNHLKDYAKRRNQIVDPHAVSRISCYLNLGILSIFDVLFDVWQISANRAGYSTATTKFLEEVVKWREIGYVHTFASPNYHTASHVLPKWAHEFLESQQKQGASKSIGNGVGYSYEQLESAGTDDETWNAMQRYLIETGELHNNARMTWGKTVVHWQASVANPEEVLWQLCCLNDRFALDGLSPPSYAGILWCFGWCDKPASGKSISTKWAYNYRKGPDGFEEAKDRLYNTPLSAVHDSPAVAKKARYDLTEPKSDSPPSIRNFFSPVAKA